MNAAGDGHTSDGADRARRPRKSLFSRARDFFEFKSRSDDLPVFLAAPWFPREPSQKHPSQEARSHIRSSLSFDALSARLVKCRVAWTLRRPPLGISEHVARVALIVALAPLPIVLSPNREAPPTEATPPKFSFENRLSFGRGLGERLKSDTAVLSLEQSAAPTKQAQDVAPPDPGEEKQGRTLTKLDPERHQSPIATDERRWSLPFESTDYAIEDLPTTPDAAFRMGVTVSIIANVPPRVTAENDTRTVRTRRASHRAEARKKGPIKVRVVRLESLPPAVQAAILQQRQAAAPSSFPFFLGAPPPPAPPEKAPPKKSFSFPESVHDTFKNEY